MNNLLLLWKVNFKWQQAKYCIEKFQYVEELKLDSLGLGLDLFRWGEDGHRSERKYTYSRRYSIKSEEGKVIGSM